MARCTCLATTGQNREKAINWTEKSRTDSHKQSRAESFYGKLNAVWQFFWQMLHKTDGRRKTLKEIQKHWGQSSNARRKPEEGIRYAHGLQPCIGAQLSESLAKSCTQFRHTSCARLCLEHVRNHRTTRELEIPKGRTSHPYMRLPNAVSIERSKPGQNIRFGRCLTDC